MTTSQAPKTLTLWTFRAVHRCHGGDQPCSHALYQKEAVAPDRTWRCTTLTMAVCTATSSDHPGSWYARPCLGGHRPRGGGATKQVVAVPSGQHTALGLLAGHRHRGGGAPDKGWWCPHGSPPSRVSPPFLHLSHHLYKCANTPSVSLSCASVFAFS